MTVAGLKSLALAFCAVALPVSGAQLPYETLVGIDELTVKGPHAHYVLAALQSEQLSAILGAAQARLISQAEADSMAPYLEFVLTGTGRDNADDTSTNTGVAVLRLMQSVTLDRDPGVTAIVPTWSAVMSKPGSYRESDPEAEADAMNMAAMFVLDLKYANVGLPGEQMGTSR